MANRRVSLLAALSLTALVCYPAGHLYAQQGDADEAQLTADLVEAGTWLQLERERNAQIGEALSADGASGIRGQLRNYELVELTRRDLVMDALERNLNIQRGGLGVDIAQAALTEAEAVFDPVFNVSLVHSESKKYDRIEVIDDKFKEATKLIIDQNGQPHQARTFEEGIIEYVGYDRFRPAQRGQTTEFASESNIFGTDVRDNLDLSYIQALPWGFDLALSYGLQNHDTFFVNNIGARRAGLATFGNYHRPWTVSLSGSLLLPLPWSRNFGEHSAREVSVRVAGIANSRAEQNARSLINTTLRDVDVAYYELVRAVLFLDIALANRRQVQDLVASTGRLQKAELITAHQKSEVDAEFERVSGEVESAWADYFRASNNLNRLLDQDARRLILPVGYSASITEQVQFRLEDEAIGDASNNPTYRARAEDVRVAEALSRQAANDARPNLFGDVSVTYSQIDQSFGHEGLDESLADTFDPDRRQYGLGVTFVRPWGNRGAEAVRDSAALEVSARQALLAQELNRLNRELDDALVDYDSALARVDITARNLKLKQSAYDKALDAQSRRTVTEFEIITQSRELLTAHRNWVAALALSKQAQTRVLAAAGLLPERYGELTSLSEVDRLRLLALNAQHQLHFFGGASQ